MLLRATGNLDQALAVQRRVIAINPTLPDSFREIGVIQQAQGNYREALASFTTAKQLLPPTESSYLLDTQMAGALLAIDRFPEAVALARNRGIALAGLTTVNLDFIRSYRPQTNVVARPTAGTGRGYSLVGHHEIMIPLLAAALVES